MVTKSDILWFKTHFGSRISSRLAGTPFDIDMLIAIACQETGELWSAMRKIPTLSPDQIVALCCGDTLDANKGRKAFPQNKADLLAVPKGQEMFTIARDALLNMAAYVPGYGFANGNDRKFCRGYGVFQYDLQFFLSNPSYFLERKYEVFEHALDRALGELKRGLKKLGLQSEASLSDTNFCKVAICYNTGGYQPSKGLRQGHSVDGKYYGEFIRDYLAMARTLALPGETPAVAPLPTGTAAMPASSSPAATGEYLRVDTMISTLRLRSEPRRSVPPGANVLAELPDGHLVRAIGPAAVSGFREVETTLGGALFRGYAAASFLKTTAEAEPASAEPIVLLAHGVEMPRSSGSVTKRTEFAGAHSLNEGNMPGRTGEDPITLRAELGAIIAYVKPDSHAHLRYKPRDGLTFCNIYAHDYCQRAGAYLPRVWWTGAALMKIASGHAVPPLVGGTIEEFRANGLFRWLRDFGPGFGWRQETTLENLQNHANMGGVALIVARRTQENRSGHIVMVVPETAQESARRSASGAVVMPLQSQAGAVNFSYGLGTLNWWLDGKFAESAFWVHA